MKLKKEIIPLPPQDEIISKSIVHAAYRVHTELGPGLLESVYEICFCHELKKAGLSFQNQVQVPLVYDGLRLDNALRVDVLVDNRIVCELKAVDVMIPVYDAQLLTYLKLMNLRLGFLINFNSPLIKDGIKRMIL